MNEWIDKITNLIAQTFDFIIYGTLELLFQEKVMSVLLETQLKFNAEELARNLLLKVQSRPETLKILGSLLEMQTRRP